MPALHEFLPLLLVLAATAIAAFWDVRRGVIPNRLVLATSALGLGVNLAFAMPTGTRGTLATLAASALGALVCATLPGALYAMKCLGGGDLKLLTVLGVCLGPVLGFELQVYAFALGAIYAIGKMILAGALWKMCFATYVGLTNPLLPRRFRRPLPEDALFSIPFAPAMCAGALALAAAHWSLP